MWNLIFLVESEGIREQGDEENIWDQGREINRRMERSVVFCMIGVSESVGVRWAGQLEGTCQMIDACNPKFDGYVEG
jgi:hypothetical protein